jgi:hypothetical protein
MLRRHNIRPNGTSSHDISKNYIMFLSSRHIHILLGLWRTLASWSNRPKREHEDSHRSPTEFYYSDYGPSSYKAHATSIRQNYISFTWLSITLEPWPSRPIWEHKPSHRSPIEFYYSGHSPSSYKAHGTSIRQNYISFTWLSIRAT